MPRLVSILPSDLARTRGGAERYAFELHAALAERAPSWELDGLVAASSDPDRWVPDGWRAVGGRAAARRPVGDAIDARTVLRESGTADVVLCHQWRTAATTTWRLAARTRPDTRLVVMDHGAGTRRGYAMAALPLPGADLALHQTAFEQAISPLRGRRHAVIRGGIDDRRFFPVDAAERDVDFLLVGRFVPYKGQRRLIDALPEGARARLVGPSDSEDPAYLADVVAAAEARGVEISFDVSDEELVAAYRTARYTVQVPLDVRRYKKAAPPELLGLTMLEAMACGSIPICPGDGASSEFVVDGRTGLTYDAESDGALRETLGRALAERDGEPALRAGAVDAAGTWTWSCAAESLLEMLAS